MGGPGRQPWVTADTARRMDKAMLADYDAIIANGAQRGKRKPG
jgi:hypothetical protein